MFSMSKVLLPAVVVVVVALSGCSTAKFSCTGNMKGGPGCRSVSQVYMKLHEHRNKATPSPTGLPATIRPGEPLRSDERVMRVWIAPWVDNEDDYHDQTYVYLVLNHGRWYIDKARADIKRRFAPRVIPPVKRQESAQGAPAQQAGSK